MFGWFRGVVKGGQNSSNNRGKLRVYGPPGPTNDMLTQFPYTPPTMAIRDMAITKRDTHSWTENLGTPIYFYYPK